jgi:hypothetical protein
MKKFKTIPRLDEEPHFKIIFHLRIHVYKIWQKESNEILKDNLFALLFLSRWKIVIPWNKNSISLEKIILTPYSFAKSSVKYTNL